MNPPKQFLSQKSSAKKCRQCGESFLITAEDLALLEKISPIFGGSRIPVPTPTLCPECRQQRQFIFRNERKLYHRQCDASGKALISNYGPHADIKIYDQQVWWSDQWSAKDYGRDFDFKRPFFEQYAELQKEVPQLALSVWNSENSNFCNYVGNVRNSYLVFGSIYSEDCFYGSPYYSKDCVDTLVVRECERCYECIDCRKLYECCYCRDCHSSNNLLFCYDLQGCKDCIGCAGLRNKQYYVFNQQYSKEAYKKFRDTLDLCNPSTRAKLAQELERLKLTIPHRYMQSKNTENVSGNYIFQSKNVHDSYYADRCQDVRYCTQVVDLKDCSDNHYTEENELCYEYLGSYQNVRTIFSRFCNKVSECFYCDSCFSSQQLFGCIGMRNSRYCILNKQYSKEEYEVLVPRIIDQMKENGEWGEFFPVAISPFCYNESVANEYFPLERVQALKLGAQWKDDDTLNRYEGPAITPPEKIEEVGDEIIKQILTCTNCQRNYKVIEAELKFYRQMKLPVPLVCPDCRHRARMNLRNPRKLWERTCFQCHAPIRTSYAPTRSEKVYCESCYLKEVY